jgi:tetratricopeptide (TPR) repeat protein
MSKSRITFWTGCGLIGTLLTVALWTGHGWWLRERRAGLATRCREAIAANRWDELQAVSADWCSWDADNAQAWLFAAQAAESRKDWPRVADYLGRLPDSDSRTVPALIERVRLLFEELNQPLEAVATCARILRIEPRASRAHSRLIFFYAMSLQRQEMVRCIRQAIAAGSEPPEAYVYLFGTDWIVLSNALSINSHWLKTDPDYEPFLVARAGLITSMAPGQAADPFDPNSPKAGDTALIDAYLETYPQNLEVLAYHLRKSAEAGDYARMAELLARAPAAAENDSRFWRYKGTLHLERKELASAKEAFASALQVNPYDWTSRHQLSNVLRLAGETKEAEQQLELARQGKEIERAIKRLANAADASADLLEQLARYAAESGDRQVATALRVRLSQ